MPIDKIDAIADKQAEPTPAPIAAPQQPQTDNAVTRVSLIASQRPAFIDAIDRVLRRYAFDTAKEREKRKDDSEYQKWLTDFTVEHQAFCVKHLAKPMDALAEVVRVDVSRETGKDVPAFPNFMGLQLRQLAERVAVARDSADDVVDNEIFRIANCFAQVAYDAVRVDPGEPIDIDGFPLIIAQRFTNKPEMSAPSKPIVVVQPSPPAPPPQATSIQVYGADGFEEMIAKRMEGEVKLDDLRQALKEDREAERAERRAEMEAFVQRMTPPAPQQPQPIVINFPKDAIRVDVAPGITNINKGAVEVNIPTNNYPAVPSGDLEVTPKANGGFSMKRVGGGGSN